MTTLQMLAAIARAPDPQVTKPGQMAIDILELGDRVAVSLGMEAIGVVGWEG